ncbi:hypothetical protein [Adhaeribacter arboris]|uniref:hypothetical protein n=1 Tax=Adhaeribacter arboris TaxID=2072846 RepID=UPI0011B1C6DD|nr:hypothetical protein [Adhaeribacter arboris]
MLSVYQRTPAKDFAGTSNKGKRFNCAPSFIFHLNDKSKVDQIKINWNHVDFIKQLNAYF